MRSTRPTDWADPETLDKAAETRKLNRAYTETPRVNLFCLLKCMGRGVKMIAVMTYSVNTIIEPHKRELSSLCERYRVAKLYIFGSVVNGDFDSTSSDIDFLAQFKDRAPTASYAERFLGLEGALQSVFKRPVDLLTVEGLKSSGFRNTVEQTRLLVYDSDDAR